MMRRKDREITNRDELAQIMKKCDACRLAFFDKDFPYIIPMNFGFERKDDEFNLYFHCANEGKKLDLLKENCNVGFEMDCSHKLIENEIPCEYTMEFESIAGSGITEIVCDDEKVKGLTFIMQKYSDKSSFEFNERMVKAVTILKLTVKNITGKRLGVNK